MNYMVSGRKEKKAKLSRNSKMIFTIFTILISLAAFGWLTLASPAFSQEAVSWQRIGHPGDARKIAACFNGSIWALNQDKSLWVNRSGGRDGGWTKVTDLPRDTRNIICGAGVIYFQKDNRELWTVVDPEGPRRSMNRVGKPWGAAEIAGADDSSYDFPVFWALNDDRTLWRNGEGGVDGKWKKMGKPGSASKIAATKDAVFALNNDKTLWINRRNGADGSWQKIDRPHAAMEIGAYEYNGNLRIYALNNDYTLWEGRLVRR